MTSNASKLELGPDATSEQVTPTRSHSLGEMQEVKVGRHDHGIVTSLADIMCTERIFTFHDSLHDDCSYGYVGVVVEVQRLSGDS